VIYLLLGHGLVFTWEVLLESFLIAHSPIPDLVRNLSVNTGPVNRGRYFPHCQFTKSSDSGKAMIKFGCAQLENSRWSLVNKLISRGEGPLVLDEVDENVFHMCF